MKEFIEKHKIKLIVLISVFGLFWLLFGLRYIPAFSEWYSTTIGRFYGTIIGWITSLVPFSIFEILIFVAIVCLILWIVFFILRTKKRGIQKSGVMILNLILTIFTVCTLYVGTAGMSYYRKPLNMNLNTKIETTEYENIAFYYTEELKECIKNLEFKKDGSLVNPYSPNELSILISQEYDKINNPQISNFNVRAKPLYLTSWMYSELNICGVTFSPTGEANYNYKVPSLDLPTTIAHEMAHTKGIMREDEANQLALYVCLNSQNYFIKYSGLVMVFDSILPFIEAKNDKLLTENYFKQMTPEMWASFANSNAFWESYHLLRDFSEWWNNLYLKIFGNQTTASYIDPINTGTEIINDEPVYQIYGLSPYQNIYIDHYLKEKSQ